MRKKVWLMMVAIIMIFAMTACGGEEPKNKETNISTNTDKEKIETTPVQYDNSTLEGILKGIQDEVNKATEDMTSSLDVVNEKVGNSYEEYVENKDELTNWYGLIVDESQKLFGRINEKSVEYFKLVASSLNHEDKDAIDDAMDEFYDAVYDDAMDDYYDAIYDDLMDNVYDTYYDGIVEDGYDIVAYEIYSDEHSECYKAWSEAHSEIYKTWSDAHSEMYGMWSAVNSGFYWNKYDVETILKEWKKEKEEAEQSEKEEQKKAEELEKEEKTTEQPDESEDVDPEFKELMDSYEAFFDEYIKFMKEYQDADTDEMLELMDDYVDYMTDYADMIGKMEALEGEDMNAAEALYYTEVTTRIYEKLLEVE